MATTDAIQQAIKNSGLDQKTLGYIKQKAETGVQMDTSTPQKQSVYDAYQNYYINQVQQKASQGAPLDSPNDWKNSIYSASQQPSQVTVDQYMQQATGATADKMASMQQYLQNSAQAQIGSQTAQLGFARDQALADIDRALNQAVANGEMSIRQAQQQFEAAQKEIQHQAYIDSEHTNLTAYDRGIQNSAQMIGLMQGDQARTNNRISTAMTTRDQAINEINHQLNSLKYDAEVNRGLANSQYNYGLAGAQGDIYANMYNQMAQMDYESWNKLQDQNFNLYGQQLQQQYNLETMNMANKFDLNKLSIQQKYQLEQMATAQGYDLQNMSLQQQYQLAQMAQSFGYDMSLQSSNQNFQAGQNALDRNVQFQLQQMRQNHDLSMLSAEQQAQLQQYETELGRKLAQYQPGTKENALLTSEFEFALQSMQKESAAQIASELGATQLANLLESYPKTIPDVTDKKKVDAYNSQVEAINAQVTKLMGSSANQYTMDKLRASSKSEQEKNGFLEFLKGGLKLITPINTLP